ncbi:16S rRNA (guanine(527)-N(7))-methyltransferase RsmG [Sulfitobacter sp.]|uniref:16S rRNA (guanine(527)-N(7))-methyltransferase RsmG n=1 Tax=Sulfitobacter sp. TaxID=1903071 RepID=UPI003001439D
MTDDVLRNVSRETMDRLHQFEALVLKWTKKINLISKGDASHVWERHIVDSVQVFNAAPEAGDWVDIGSGGGFPGIVAAILAKDITPERKFILVDSDQRKCAFLRTAVRELNLNVEVYANRVDQLVSFSAAVLSARAMDDLNSLLEYADRHLASDGTALFPKGASWAKEHQAAQKHWSYNLDVIKSKTNADATILKIKELTRV